MTTAPLQQIAIFDLGSNTARLILAWSIPGHAWRLADEIREVVRLRQGLTADGLSEAAIERGLSALRLFKHFCDSQRVDMILTAATSAVRDAANGPAFIQTVEREIGLSLNILDGKTESYYGVLGALNEVALSDGFVLDLGGGSAQISQVRDRRFVEGHSITLGALALAERFVNHDPIKDSEYRAIKEEIARQIKPLPWRKPKNAALIGLGGTIRNLAQIEARRQNYPLNTLHGFTLTRDSIDTSIDLFRTLPLKKRREIPGLKEDRADIILPGAMAVRAIMAHLGIDELAISVGGVREGLFFEHFWQHLSYPVISDIRRFSPLNMARNYGYQQAHANHVRYLAGRLFDQLAPLHGYGPAERELLDAAALLHDLGTVVNYEDHHKYSQMLVASNGLAGYSPREIALIALLTRYHRKGTPDTEEYDRLLDKRDKSLLQQLAAMLRLAEYLERGRNGLVSDVTAAWNDQTLHLTLIADHYPAVELWGIERYAAPLAEAAFQRNITLDSTAPPPGTPATP